MFKKLIKNTLKYFSYDIKKIHNPNVITFNSEDQEIFNNLFEICEKESLNVSKERFLSLFQSVKYIYKNNIKGDFVECGVFMGGSAMMIAYSIMNIKDPLFEEKRLWLYDTFTGMANVHESDVNILNQKANEKLKKTDKKKNSKDIWAYSPISYVKENMIKTGLDSSQVVYIEGLVEETLNNKYPEKISLLRLDTDFYLSTKKNWKSCILN